MWKEVFSIFMFDTEDDWCFRNCEGMKRKGILQMKKFLKNFQILYPHLSALWCCIIYKGGKNTILKNQSNKRKKISFVSNLIPTNRYPLVLYFYEGINSEYSL